MHIFVLCALDFRSGYYDWLGRELSAYAREDGELAKEIYRFSMLIIASTEAHACMGSWVSKTSVARESGRLVSCARWIWRANVGARGP